MVLPLLPKIRAIAKGMLELAVLVTLELVDRLMLELVGLLMQVLEEPVTEELADRVMTV